MPNAERTLFIRHVGLARQFVSDQFRKRWDPISVGLALGGELS